MFAHEAAPDRFLRDRVRAWPKNVTPILLPSRSPELNPVEQVGQFLRANYLSNRDFDDYETIIDAACDAWPKLLAKPLTCLRLFGPF